MSTLYQRVKDKYPYAMLTEIGHYMPTEGGGLKDVSLSTRVDEPMNKDVTINLIGARGTKRVITLTAVQLVQLYREHKVKGLKAEELVKDSNKQLSTTTFSLEVKSNHLFKYKELVRWYIDYSIVLLVQLKYHNPKLFKETWRAYNYFATLNRSPKFSILLKAGKESRPDGSIFDRALHHYTKAMENR